jgi:hypothetical protein
VPPPLAFLFGLHALKRLRSEKIMVGRLGNHKRDSPDPWRLLLLGLAACSGETQGTVVDAAPEAGTLTFDSGTANPGATKADTNAAETAKVDGEVAYTPRPSPDSDTPMPFDVAPTDTPGPDDGPATTCGDGTCDPGENGLTCEQDCGPPPDCGNGVCEPGEKPANCPMDCGASGAAKCADGLCQKPESPGSCALDCDASVTGIVQCLKDKCGSEWVACVGSSGCVGAIEAALQCLSGCDGDQTCGEFCADQASVDKKGEGLANCGFAGCNGADQGGICGNGKCEKGETQGGCPSDCTK